MHVKIATGFINDKLPLRVNERALCACSQSEQCSVAGCSEQHNNCSTKRIALTAVMQAGSEISASCVHNVLEICSADESDMLKRIQLGDNPHFAAILDAILRALIQTHRISLTRATAQCHRTAWFTLKPARKKSHVGIPERWVKGACAMSERQSGKRQRPQFTKSPQPESEHLQNLPQPNSKIQGCQTTPTRACTHTCATALMLISSLEASADWRCPRHLAHSCTASGLLLARQPPKPFCATSITRGFKSRSQQRHSTTAPTAAAQRTLRTARTLVLDRHSRPACPLHGPAASGSGVRSARPAERLRAPGRALRGVDDVQRLHVAQVLHDERAVQVRHVLVVRVLAHARTHLGRVKPARRAPA